MKIRVFWLFAFLLSMTSAFAAVSGMSATPPKLKGSSSEKVLLRYHFKAGESIKMAIDMTADTEMKFQGKSTRVPMQMLMDADIKVLNVADDGSAGTELSFTRLAMLMRSPQGTLSYDSSKDKTLPDPAFKPLAAMVGVKIPCTITERGETRDMDLSALLEAMRQSGLQDDLQMTKSLNDSFQGGFAQFPELPVSAGETFDAGKIARDMNGLASIDMALKYKVLSVSADKRYVVLKPITKITANFPGSIPFTLDYIGMDGWLLLDLGAGNIDKSYLTIKMKMVSQDKGEQKIVMYMNMIMKYFMYRY